MHEPLNVFDHQLFRLRLPTGGRVEKSFKQLLTEPDVPYALDYAQPFYDVAALNLLSYLAQVAFEPETAAELAVRIAAPMTEADFEQAVAPLRATFALTGDGPRVMQGPAPEDPKKAEPLGVAVFIAPSGDRQFLHRADADWAVAPDQAALFLFARNTFYEGTGGRGYQKGTNGDTPIRALATVPAEGDTVWLRKSLWLNVLSLESQRQYAGAYAMPGGAGYDGLFWARPPAGDVPVGGITLRAGLGWMTAYHWLWFEHLDAPGICPLTGEKVHGLAARTASKRSTGIAYGAKGDLESGVAADRLFRHPNVPTEKLFDKNGDPTGERPFLVARTEGLTPAIGAAFFGGLNGAARARYTPAPAVAQLYAGPVSQLGLTTRLLVFGFHMLSTQKNVHGGVEMDTFAYTPVASDARAATAVMDVAAEMIGGAAAFAQKAAYELRQAVQRTVGAGVRAEQDGETGRITLKKLEKTPSVDDPFGRDVLAAYWRAVQRLLVDHAGALACAASADASAFAAEQSALAAAWEDAVAAEAKKQYAPVFEHYSLLPRTMPYAHAARRLFFSALSKARTVQSQPESA